MLEKLLSSNPPYCEALAEQLLREYLRIHHHRIRRVSRCGIPTEDIEQELRIALWQAWRGYESRSSKIKLRQWLSYKLDYCLRGLPRALARKYERCGLPLIEESEEEA